MGSSFGFCGVCFFVIRCYLFFVVVFELCVVVGCGLILGCCCLDDDVDVLC